MIREGGPIKLALALGSNPVQCNPAWSQCNDWVPSQEKIKFVCKVGPRVPLAVEFGCFTEVQLSEAKSNARSELGTEFRRVNCAVLFPGKEALSGSPFFPYLIDASPRCLHMVIDCLLPP